MGIGAGNLAAVCLFWGNYNRSGQKNIRAQDQKEEKIFFLPFKRVLRGGDKAKLGIYTAWEPGVGPPVGREGVDKWGALVKR